MSRLNIVPIHHHETPRDALRKAMDKADDMESVLIIYEGKPGSPTGSFNNNLSVSQSLWLVELFRHWLLLATLKG